MCDIWLGLLLSRWCSYRWFAVLLGSFCLRKYFKHFPQGDTWWQTQHLTKCESYWHTLALRLVFDPSLRFETVEVQTSSSSKFFKIQTKSFLMSFYLFAPPFLCCRPVVRLTEFWGSFLQLSLCFNLHILVAEVFLPFFYFYLWTMKHLLGSHVFVHPWLHRRTTTSSDSSLPSCVICWCWKLRRRRKQRKHTGGKSVPHLS